MGGGKRYNEGMDAQNALAKQQQSQGLAAYNAGTANIDKSLEMYKPSIDLYKAMASGDFTKVTQALAPKLATIQQQSNKALENINSSVPSGAARSFAKSSLMRDAAGARAGALNEGYMSAFQGLSGMGDKFANLGLQEMGAGMRGQEASGQTWNAYTETARKRQADKWNQWTGLASMAMGPLTGGLSMAMGNKSSGQAPASWTQTPAAASQVLGQIRW